MKNAEFEEKEYEGPLYNQLEQGSPFIWPPGQVLEHIVGFDRAMMTDNPRFWKIIAKQMPHGIMLDPMWWPEFRPLGRRQSRQLPTFRFNLFIQAKRSKICRRLPRHIKATGMTAPGWCFEIDAHQQSALDRVASRLGGDAAIVYAAPAFHTSLELYGHISTGTIIEHSTFPDVGRLNGHQRWFYNQPGGDGVPNPEALYSRGPSLFARIQAMRDSRPVDGANVRYGGLLELAENITTSLQDKAPITNPRVALFQQELHFIDQELRSSKTNQEFMRAFLKVGTFADHFNLKWFVLQEATEVRPS